MQWVEMQINKAEFACHTFSNKFFCDIFTCMDNYICQFLIVTGVGVTALVWLKCKMYTNFDLKDTGTASLRNVFKILLFK